MVLVQLEKQNMAGVVTIVACDSSSAHKRRRRVPVRCTGIERAVGHYKIHKDRMLSQELLHALHTLPSP